MNAQGMLYCSKGGYTLRRRTWKVNLNVKR